MAKKMMEGKSNSLALLRNARGMSQRQLAEAVGISAAFLNNLENGRDIERHRGEVLVLAEFLDVTPEQVMLDPFRLLERSLRAGSARVDDDDGWHPRFDYINLGRYAAFCYGYDPTPEWFKNGRCYDDGSVFCDASGRYHISENGGFAELMTGDWIVLKPNGHIRRYDDRIFNTWFARVYIDSPPPHTESGVRGRDGRR